MSFDEIIAKVKAHPELWQSSHPFYRHRVVSARTWKEIATELKADENLIRKRWKHLKDNYRKEHKKILAKTIPTSFWHHYNELLFLSNEFVYIESTAATEVSDNEKKSNDDADSDDAPLKAKRPRRATIEPTVATSKVQLPAPVSRETTGIHSLITRSTDSGKLNFILNRLNAMEEIIESRNQAADDTTKNDTDYMFILSLLPIMKKLTDIQKLQFRGKMNDWLLDIVTQNEYTDRFEYQIYEHNDSKDIQPSTG